MKIAIPTRSYDNVRSGANTHETILNPQNVGQRGVKLLFAIPLSGDARGCEAQPLIIPAVPLPDGSKRDVLYAATMANKIFAFDAATGAQLWAVELGTPVKSTKEIDYHLTNDHWGILSTPVIDVAAHVMYVCTWSSPDGSAKKATHSLHALRLRDGSAVHPALHFEGVSFQPGHGLPALQFRSTQRKQRAALLLVKNTVFIAFGTVAETGASARGWILAVDTAAFKITAVWASTSRGTGAGIWQAGGGPAADADGNIYVVTGNGDFDGVTDFGESIIKLQYTPATPDKPASLSAIDWWSPWTDDARVPGERAEERTAPVPTTFRKLPDALAHGALHATNDAWKDQDLGSGGPVLVPNTHAVLFAGKDGILYTGNTAALGKTQPADLEAPKAAGNYSKLKAPPIFYTYFPGFQLNPVPQNPATLNVLVDQRTHHMHGTPVVWKSAQHGLMHFCWGENAALRAWTMDAAGRCGYLATGIEIASAHSPIPPGGMPGGMMTLSAHGDRDGILWASIPYEDANLKVSPGRFLAYDVSNLGRFPDGSGWIKPLWDSQQWNWAFSHNKFNVPVVWNGRIYLSTYDGHILVLGLA
jgi:outer membrane protein assembly factor BamB